MNNKDLEEKVKTLVHSLSFEKGYVCSVDVLMRPNYLSKNDYENWRFGKTYRTTRNWIKKDSIIDAFSYRGEALIERKVFSIDTTLMTQENIPDVIQFKDQSRKILKFFPGYGSILNYKLSKSNYWLKIHYWHPQRMWLWGKRDS